MITLNPAFYEEVCSIAWFTRCGKAEDLPCGIHFAESLEQAMTLLSGPLWRDVRTEAQGDLTGYLAKHHYTSYGGFWNNLAKDSRSRLERDLHPLLREALAKAGLPDITNDVLLDINRAALEAVYMAKFQKAPRFFNRLLTIYHAGHIPCGWTEVLEVWPRGEVIAY